MQLIVLVMVLFLAGLAFFRLSPAADAFLYIMLSAAYVLTCRVLYGKGILLHVLWIPAGLAVVCLTAIGYHAVNDAREKLRLTRIFQQYVSPDVVDEIVKMGTDKLELGGKPVDIAVMFVDIRDFTPLSENLTAPQVVDVVNLYLRKVTEFM
jgi:adenylate cyclase